MDSRADDVIKRVSQLHSERTTFESHWRECAELVLPRADDFSAEQQQGAKRTRKIYDAFPAMAAERGAAVFENALTPIAQTWHNLTTGVEALDDDVQVARYLGDYNKLLWSMRYSPRANFASQMHECFLSLIVFGTACLLVQEAPSGRGARYKAIHVGEIYICENENGIVDTVYRKFQYTTRQAVSTFGADCPNKIAKELEKQPDKKWTFIHCVRPRSERKRGHGAEAMAFEELYVSQDPKEIVRTGGFNEQPYIVSRYVTSPRETWGRSPVMTMLPDIKTLQELERINLDAGALAVDPVKLVHDDASIAREAWQPGAWIDGALDDDGRPLVQPQAQRGDVRYGLEYADQRRRTIDDGLFGVYFRVLLENPQMTATQAMLIAQQQGQMSTPIMSRQQSEMLGPMIRRESAILHRQGLAPEPPEALIEHMMMTGEPLSVEYESPMLRAARSDAAVAALRTFEQLAPIAQVDPSVYGRFNMPALAKVIADANGLPAEALLSDDEIAEKQQQEAMQQQAAMALQAAPVAASAAKDLAQAQEAAAANPGSPMLWTG